MKFRTGCQNNCSVSSEKKTGNIFLLLGGIKGLWKVLFGVLLIKLSPMVAVNFSGCFPEENHANSGPCAPQYSFQALHRTQKTVISDNIGLFDLGNFSLVKDRLEWENSVICLTE